MPNDHAHSLLFGCLIQEMITAAQQWHGWQPWTMPRDVFNAAPIVQFQGYQPPPQPPLRSEYKQQQNLPRPSSPHQPGSIPQQFETLSQLTPPPLIDQNTWPDKTVKTVSQMSFYETDLFPPLALEANGVIQMFDDNLHEADLPEARTDVKTSIHSPHNNSSRKEDTDELKKELEKELQMAIPSVITEIQMLQQIPEIQHSQPNPNEMKSEISESDLEKIIQEGLEEATQKPMSTVTRALLITLKPLKTTTTKEDSLNKMEKDFHLKVTPTTGVQTLPPWVVTEFIDLPPIGSSKVVEFSTTSAYEPSTIEPTHSMRDQEESIDEQNKNTNAQRLVTLMTEKEIEITTDQIAISTDMSMPEKVIEKESNEVGIESITLPSTEMFGEVDKMTEKSEGDKNELKEMLAEMKVSNAVTDGLDKKVSHSAETTITYPTQKVSKEAMNEKDLTLLTEKMVDPNRTIIETSNKSDENLESTTMHPIEIATSEQEAFVKPTDSEKEEQLSTKAQQTTTIEFSQTESPLISPITTTRMAFEEIELSTTHLLPTQEIVILTEPKEAEETDQAKEQTTVGIINSTPIEQEPASTLEQTIEMESKTFEPTTTTVPIQEEACPVQNDETEHVKGDVLFLIDSSTSVGKEQFMRAIKLIENTVRHFNNIGPNGVQISLVQFNREPFLEFSLRRHTCLPHLIKDITNTEYMNGVSNLGRAIEKVIKFAFTPNRGDRPDVKNVLVLVIDGQSDDRVQIPYEIASMNSTSVLVIATLEAHLDNIMELASHNQDQVFNLTDALNKPLDQRLADHIRTLLTEHQTYETTTLNISTPDQTTDLIMGNKEDSIHETLTSPIYTEHSTTSETQTISTKSSLESMVAQALNKELDDALANTTTYQPNVTTTLQSTELETLPFAPVDLSVTLAPQSGGYSEVSTMLSDDITIECLPEGIQTYFRLPEKFSGFIVAKGYEDEPNCSLEVPAELGTSQIVAFSIYKGECGLHAMESTDPRGINQSIVLNLLHNKRLITANNRAYIIECFSPIEQGHESELETKLNIGQSVPWSKTIRVQVPMPKCYYSLRRDSPHGPLIQFARIGEIIYHRWECDGGKNANSVYGLHVHDCKAGNSSKNVYNLVDGHGCSTDNVLLEEITYGNDELVAFAKSQVFTLIDVYALKFTCKVGLCIRDGDGCEGLSPPICSKTNGSTVLLSRTARRCDEAFEAALTSELEANLYDIRDPIKPIEVRRALSFSPLGIIFGAILLGCILGALFFMLQSQSTSKTKKLDEESISSEYLNFETTHIEANDSQMEDSQVNRDTADSALESPNVNPENHHELV